MEKLSYIAERTKELQRLYISSLFFEHTMSFNEYLKNRQTFNTPAGHFTHSARLDPNMPDASTWQDLKQYLEGDSLLSTNLTAAYEVWMAYQKSLQKVVKRSRGRPPKNDKRQSNEIWD